MTNGSKERRTRMKSLLVTLLGVLLGVPAYALTFGTGCANPCGVEEIVEGSTAVCTIFVGHDPGDGFDPLVVQDAAYTVFHADGTEVVPASGTPLSLMFGGQTMAAFPVTITEHPGDETLPGGLVLQAHADLVAMFGGIATPPFQEFFGDRMTVVPVSTCATPTTTTTPTTTSTTSTTLQTILGFSRFKVCGWNLHPQKCR